MQSYPTLADFESYMNTLPDEEQRWPESVSIEDDGGEPWEFLADVAIGVYSRGEQVMRVTYAAGEYMADRRT